VVLLIPAIATAYEVTSTSGWQTTPLNVSQGQLLSISAVGLWNVDHHNFSFVDPDGYSPDEDSTISQGCKLDPQLPYGKLLARIGDDHLWAVGRGGTFTAGSSGVLSFRIHEADGCQLDNAGTVTVTVTILEPSNPPPRP
jgi:hypothetical protein